MIRNQLSESIKAATETIGYHFYEGFEYRMNEKGIHLPAIWLIPPKMSRINGRNEGEATYRVILHLMHPNQRYDEPDKNLQWDAMEQNLLKITNRIISQQGVFCIENITLTPAEFTLTKQGELSVKAEFDMRMYFNNPETE